LIAALAGPALGGGFICACACDLRIAAHSATFGLPEVRLGWPPNYGLARVSSLLGRGRALQWALTGEKIGASEAQAIGLVQHVVPEAQLLRKSREVADALLKLPPLALAATKRILASEHPASMLDEQATDAFVRCLQSSDAREGVAAFLGKRSPRFEGR
jgi:enoyl-CoA hydratase